jgi:hypothetical protein
MPGVDECLESYPALKLPSRVSCSSLKFYKIGTKLFYVTYLTLILRDAGRGGAAVPLAFQYRGDIFSVSIASKVSLASITNKSITLSNAWLRSLVQFVWNFKMARFNIAFQLKERHMELRSHLKRVFVSLN